MDNGRISARYAKALYEYAAERKKEETIYEEMKFISNVFSLTPGLAKALDNPRISSEKKKELIITAAGTGISAELRRFIDMVVERKREAYFQFISLMYQTVYRKENRIIIGKLTTVKPIDSQQEQRMKAIVAEKTQGEVDFVSNVDPGLIGGFVLQVGTYQLDASVSNRLKMIKNALLQVR